MKRMRRVLALGALIAVVPVGAALAAPSSMTTHTTLHVVNAYKSKAPFSHAMATATIRYVQHDAYINVVADHLPSPASLGKRAYVVYASDGAMTDRLGALHIAGAMASVKGVVMMNKVSDIYVYAESSAQNKHPHGIEVLAAMVG